MAGKRKDPQQRFWQKVHKTETCWLWTGALMARGYGYFWNGQRVQGAHRFAYETMVGPIPDGFHLDHLCRTLDCVNPAHLEPVSHKENVRRGDAGAWQRAKTHCPKGHEYTPENTYRKPSDNGRLCRICGQERTQMRRERGEWRKSGSTSPAGT